MTMTLSRQQLPTEWCERLYIARHLLSYSRPDRVLGSVRRHGQAGLPSTAPRVTGLSQSEDISNPDFHRTYTANNNRPYAPGLSDTKGIDPARPMPRYPQSSLNVNPADIFSLSSVVSPGLQFNFQFNSISISIQFSIQFFISRYITQHIYYYIIKI